MMFETLKRPVNKTLETLVILCMSVLVMLLYGKYSVVMS